MDPWEMVVQRFWVRTALAGALLAGTAVAVPAQTPTLTMLDQLEKGKWELRERDDHSLVRTSCLGDARSMIQINHSRPGCSRYIIEDGANEVTVHYTCPGAGHGRTSIRRETNRLVQIDTQGIAEGAPFSRAIEARRVGVCNTTSVAR